MDVWCSRNVCDSGYSTAVLTRRAELLWQLDMGQKSLPAYPMGNHSKYINFWPWLTHCKQKLLSVFPSLQGPMASLLQWRFSSVWASRKVGVSTHVSPAFILAVDRVNPHRGETWLLPWLESFPLRPQARRERQSFFPWKWGERNVTPQVPWLFSLSILSP